VQYIISRSKRNENGLGGVPDFDVWDSKLETATEIADLVSLHILIIMEWN
jgi:hypothetical protein